MYLEGKAAGAQVKAWTKTQGWMDEGTFWNDELHDGRVKKAAINREAEAPTQTSALSFTIPKVLSSLIKPSLWDRSCTRV